MFQLNSLIFIIVSYILRIMNGLLIPKFICKQIVLNAIFSLNWD